MHRCRMGAAGNAAADPQGSKGVVCTLSELVMRRLLTDLERGVELSAKQQQPSLKISKQQACREYIEPLPALLRQEMLDHVLSSGRVYNTIDMMMLEVLLHSDIRHLSVRHVRKWYRERFLFLLKSHGVGLYSLHLEDIRVPVGCEMSLAKSLSAMTRLTHVSVRFDCDDAALWALGKSCPLLESLDVEGSTDVTDLGVQALCLRGATLPVVQLEDTNDTPSSSNYLCDFFERCLCLSNSVNSETSIVGLSWWRSSIMKRSRKNPCCSTLRFINVSSTKVSETKGLAVLRSCCINAKILHSASLSH